jgi:hypothetical protein
MQDMTLEEIRPGRTGQRHPAAVLARMKAAASTARCTRIRSACTATARPAHRSVGSPGRRPGRGDATVIPSMWFSIELQATTPVPEWGNQPVRMAQEEGCDRRRRREGAVGVEETGQAVSGAALTLPTLSALNRVNFTPLPAVKEPMSTAWADLRYAIRGLRRSPLFATVAILSLALGIGANSAIFTLMDQVLLRKLPVRHPEQLVMLYQRARTTAATWATRMHSYPLYQDLQQRAEPFAEVICRRLIDGVGERRQPDRARRGRDGLGQLLHDARRRSRRGPVFNSQTDDQVYQGHPVVV